MDNSETLDTLQGRIQDFKLGGGAHLKKIAPSGGGRKHFGGISCEKSRFYAKKSYFFQFWGGGGGAPRWIRPCIGCTRHKTEANKARQHNTEN